MAANEKVFRREGDYWTIAYEGATFRLKDARGLHYLLPLLEHPGKEFHVLELAAPVAPARRELKGIAEKHGLTVRTSGDAGEVLDARARSEYRRRLGDLEEELAEAQQFNDLARAGQARTEIEALTHQLSSAFGLGGRARKAGSDAERARVRIRNGIASSLKAIGRHHGGLARHLAQAVRTGTFCSYAAAGTPAWNATASLGPHGHEISERLPGTVLFSDIVSSTTRAAELGDKRWGKLLDAHDASVRGAIEAHGGREVSKAEDGFGARFDSAAQALAAALAIDEAVSALGLEVRIGVHAGEFERRGEELAGIALHIGARIASLAEPREILVSSTARDLSLGSGIEFADRGFHALHGVPGTWRLYAVESKCGGGVQLQKGEGALKLMIVDDHPMWREALRKVLERSAGGTVVAEAVDADEAVETAVAASPDVVVMDVNLPTRSGIEATRQILERVPTAKILVLSSSDERQDVVEAVRAGAQGYLVKTSSSRDVAAAVVHVAKGEMVFPPELAAVVLDELRGKRS